MCFAIHVINSFAVHIECAVREKPWNGMASKAAQKKQE